MTNPTPQPPKMRHAFAEIRAFREGIRLLARLGRRKNAFPQIENAPHVIVLPGFGTTDLSTLLTRRYLSKYGIPCEGWKNGLNLAGHGMTKSVSDVSERWTVSDTDRTYKGEGDLPALCDRITEHVRARAQELGKPVVLVGWSLGGLIAREVTRDLPNDVSAVVTLGAPIVGGPKYTLAAPYFKLRRQDIDWMDTELKNRDQRPIQQPITVVYSKSDAIVDWRATLDHVNPNVNAIEVNSPHLGMGFDISVLAHIVTAIRQQAA